MSKQARLETTLLRTITRILAREVKDPAVGFTTVTAVKLTSDLSHLTIYYTTLEEGKREETAKALERSKAFVRTTLGKHVTMRKLPALHFKYDESLDRGNRIERGLKDVINEDE